jgi:hypothetical protein
MSYMICRSACPLDAAILWDSTMCLTDFSPASMEGKTRKAGVPVDVPFAHVWTVAEGYLQRLRAFTDTAVLADALKKN